MKMFLCFAIIWTCVFSLPAFAQSPVKDADYISSSETMHVHFDKDIYLPGETIWFKAYCYNVMETSLAATNFYTAIYDERGKIIQQKIFPIVAGSCNGSFKIPDTIATERIQFRAFTKAMIINDTSNVYTNIITVYNPNKNKDEKQAVSPALKNIQFFSEGMQAVAEVENQIAFKATYSDGSPAIINGQIMQEGKNKPVDTFFTNNLGMGKLTLTPYPGKKYFALWKDDNGKVIETPLPAISRYGVALHAALKNNNIEYSFIKNHTSDSLALLHLVAQFGNYQFYKADLKLENEMELATAKFSVEALPPGLLQLTLFDKYWTPLQQRLVFITGAENDKKALGIADKINTNIKAKNTIEITLPDTTMSNLSVSIADISFCNPAHTQSITADLLFNKQVSGLTENVNQFLDKDDADMLLLTHSWKKYDWQKLQVKTETVPEPLDNYITLFAKSNKKEVALPANDIPNLILTSANKNKQFYTFKSAGENTFKINNLIFFDTVKVNCQLQKNKELNQYLAVSEQDNVQMQRHIPALQEAVAKRRSVVDTFFTTPRQQFNSVQTIDAVLVNSKNKIVGPKSRIEQLDEEYASGFFRGILKATTFNLIDDTTAVMGNPNLQQYFRSKIPGLVVSLETRRLSIRETKMINNKLEDVLDPVLVFIDENELDEVQLTDLPTSDYAYAKYVPGIVIGSSTKSSAGAFYIYTKKGNESGPAGKALSSNYLTGYNSPGEFTEPDYANQALLQIPDRRTTLYWNPNLIMDKNNNKVKIDFYNNDASKKMLLTIEGVNANGKIIHVEKVLE